MSKQQQAPPRPKPKKHDAGIFRDGTYFEASPWSWSGEPRRALAYWKRALITAGCLLAALSFALACAVSGAFAAVLAVYLVLTSAYICVLKSYVLVDVIMLTLLYMLRIVAGAVAVGIEISPWLLAFSMFAFLSLALVKRCAELVSLRPGGSPAASGRDYQASDLDVLRPLGIGAALAAVVVFGLFIHAPGTTLRYGYPNLLWVVALGFIYLFARRLTATVRGEMRGDPVVYLLENRGSLAMLGGIVLTTMLAHTITVD